MKNLHVRARSGNYSDHVPTENTPLCLIQRSSSHLVDIFLHGS